VQAAGPLKWINLWKSGSGFLLGDETKKEEGAPPSIPLTPQGVLDYQALQNRLIEIKQKVAETDFSDKNAIMLTAEADIPYKFIIKTMDNVTFYVDNDGNIQELFPQIIIGQVVL
jgi:hypothetical protein